MIVIDKLAFIIFILIFIAVCLIGVLLGAYATVQTERIKDLQKKCNKLHSNIINLKHEIYKRDFKLFKGEIIHPFIFIDILCKHIYNINIHILTYFNNRHTIS